MYWLRATQRYLNRLLVLLFDFSIGKLKLLKKIYLIRNEKSKFGWSVFCCRLCFQNNWPCIHKLNSFLSFSIYLLSDWYFSNRYFKRFHPSIHIYIFIFLCLWKRRKKQKKKILRFAEKIKYSWKTRIVAFQRLRSCFFLSLFHFAFCLLLPSPITMVIFLSTCKRNKRFKSHL